MMNSLLNFKFIFCVLLSLNSSLTFAKVYNCDVQNGNVCNIYGLSLTREDFELVPEATNPDAIKYVDLSGTVPVLSQKNVGNICHKFPNLQEIHVGGCDVEEIQEKAFDGCHQLKRIHLHSNDFTVINKNSFKGLTQLDFLQITGGNIRKFDLDLSDATLLKVLDVSDMGMAEFSAEILQKQEQLRKLYINDNKLVDLNVEKILEYAPLTRDMYITSNKFECGRLENIVSFLKEKNVNTVLMPGRYSKTPNEVDGIECFKNHA